MPRRNLNPELPTDGLAESATIEKEPTVTLTTSALAKLVEDAARKSVEQALDERASRVQETRAAEDVHESYSDLWDQPLLLDATRVKKRPGYEQRWMRTMLDNQPDHSNIARRRNQGWEPRKLSTVPAGVAAPKTKFDEFGDVVGVHGMVLVERPVELHERYRRAKNARTKSQMDAVEQSLMQDHDPGKGFGAPNLSIKTRTTRTKAPQIADDG